MAKILENTEIKSNSDLDLIFVLGKEPGWNNEPDYLLQNRLDLAISLFNKNPRSRIVCSGGKGFANKHDIDSSEAQIMKNYLVKKGILSDSTLIEENSISGINQMVIIKTDFVLKFNPKKIAIVTDEFHIPYIELVFDVINGNECEVEYYGAKINISGKYRQLIEDYFSGRQDNAKQFISLYKRGDHEDVAKHETGYRKLMEYRINKGQSRLQMIDPKDVLEFIKTGIDPKEN